jgi:site-specific DNA-cytosine methylase
MDGEEEEKIISHGSIVPLAGGFSLGVTNIIKKPPEVIFSYSTFENNDKLYLRYLKQLGIEVPYYQLDKLDVHHIRFISKKYNYINFFHGILPCAGLSMCSQLKPGIRAYAEVNNWMYKSAYFILCCMQPKAYVFENAPGLFSPIGEPIREKLIKIAKKHGYALTFYKTNTIKHGVPQFRPRTFGIFYKGDHAPILNYYNKPMPLLSEYLKQIPKESTLQDAYMNCDPYINEYEITKFFRKIYGEDWRNTIYTTYKTHSTSYDYLKRENLLYQFKDFLDTLPNASPIVKKDVEHVIKKSEMGMNFRLSYRVLGLDRDYVYAVISEMMYRTIHPIEDRLLNIREHMYLMGLPDDYELEHVKEYSKITQNVPVAVCEDITTEIIEIINGNRILHHNSVYMQDNTKEFENIKTKALF